jgi:hypothetical protein
VRLFTLAVATGIRSIGLTVSPAMNLNKLTADKTPLIRLHLYWKSVFIRPNIEWIEESGHGSWTRNYGIFLWRGRLLIATGKKTRHFKLW